MKHSAFPGGAEHFSSDENYFVFFKKDPKTMKKFT